MIAAPLRLAAYATFLVLVTACGGGGGGGGGDFAAADPPPSGGGGGGGIGGTGLTSSGTISGTGSIFVNGVRFEVDEAEITVNGESAGETDLGLGMVVTVTGTVDDDGSNGTAERVVFEAELKGPVDSLEANADGTTLQLTILGRRVIAERTGTVFEDVSFATLAVGDVVEVSGYEEADGRLRATRIDRDDDFLPGQDTVTLKGVVSGLSGSAFFLGDRAVDAGNATLEDLPGGALANGQRVEVRGTLEGGTLVAQRVSGEDDPGARFTAGEAARVEGAITAYVDDGSFSVGGVPVDATGAAREPSGLVLRDGAVVEIDGDWDGSTLIAGQVQARRGRIKLEAPATAVDATAGTVTLGFAGGTVELSTDSRTLFDDDRDDLPFLTIGDLRSGDYIEAEAVQDGARLLATRIDRDEDDDERLLQAPVEAFVEGSSLTLLGVTFTTAGADFENAVDDDIEPAAFYANLDTGALVKVDDEDNDGNAEEVEFEFAAVLDGDRDFRDDDEAPVAPGELPPVIVDFISANYPGKDIAAAFREEDEYTVILVNGIELTFDLDGNLLEADDDDSEDDGDDTVEDGDDPGMDDDDTIDDEGGVDDGDDDIGEDEDDLEDDDVEDDDDIEDDDVEDDDDIEDDDGIEDDDIEDDDPDGP
ncbi:DUF5666 domain-containing protein [Pseudohaliea sp.]|uniref:DUF5666 domain-containing protein n=1 Tax=Pseudohaliea sp. TaxID=2740289 RepID=UPI0032EE1D41